jgi:hypothetical protein
MGYYYPWGVYQNKQEQIQLRFTPLTGGLEKQPGRTVMVTTQIFNFPFSHLNVSVFWILFFFDKTVFDTKLKILNILNSLSSINGRSFFKIYHCLTEHTHIFKLRLK